MTNLAQTPEQAAVVLPWLTKRSGDSRRVPVRSELVLPKISLVIPTLNESMNLPWLMPRIPYWVHEVIIVDGRSTDNTVETARRLRGEQRVFEAGGRGPVVSRHGSGVPSRIRGFHFTLKILRPRGAGKKKRRIAAALFLHDDPRGIVCRQNDLRSDRPIQRGGWYETSLQPHSEARS